MLRLGFPPAAVIEGSRRMVFNALATNQDDHVKNLSFRMDRWGTWKLTPAYDLTFAMGEGWTRTHQRRVRDERVGITHANLIAVADEFGLRAPGRIIEQVRSAGAEWPKFAEQEGVPADVVARIGQALGERNGQATP